MNINTINNILGITESYVAPQKMMELLLDENQRDELFMKFSNEEADLSYEWFQTYFEDEHADRKNKKQDFTPSSISKLGVSLLGPSEEYFEAAAGTGGMMIQYWNKYPDSFYILEELSDRSVPFLLFNMAIRNMKGILKHGDSLENNFKAVYKLKNGERFSLIEVISNDEPEKVD